MARVAGHRRPLHRRPPGRRPFFGDRWKELTPEWGILRYWDVIWDVIWDIIMIMRERDVYVYIYNMGIEYGIY